MALNLSSGPAEEPISTADAKAHLRVDDSGEDALIGNLVVVARQAAESFLRRALIDQTWELKRDRFFGAGATPLWVPLPPLQSVSSITYVDTAGDAQTWASSKYDVDTPAGPYAAPGRIDPAFGESWPSTRSQMNAVTITFLAGYGAAGSNVPQAILQGMYLLIGHLFANREAVNIGNIAAELPMSTEYLWRPFRDFRF